jgi:[ribosomal protein S18]-alanine N-acetyltransferase
LTTIRTFVADDADSVAALEHTLFNVPYDEPWSRDTIAAYAEFQHLCGWVVVPEADIQGYLLATVVLDEANIDNLGVHPKNQRMGIATQLLDHAVSQFRERGVANIWLEVAEPNVAARGFYEGVGFGVVYRRPRYYVGRSGETADALTMCRSLG